MSRPLPPWDSLTYFDTPVCASVGSGASPVQAVSANTRRVALIFNNSTLNATINIFLGSNTTGTPFITLGTSQRFAVLTHADVGPLVQQEFWIQGGVSGLGVTEILLSRYPANAEEEL